jgi:hypothetical protein
VEDANSPDELLLLNVSQKIYSIFVAFEIECLLKEGANVMYRPHRGRRTVLEIAAANVPEVILRKYFLDAEGVDWNPRPGHMKVSPLFVMMGRGNGVSEDMLRAVMWRMNVFTDPSTPSMSLVHQAILNNRSIARELIVAHQAHVGACGLFHVCSKLFVQDKESIVKCLLDAGYRDTTSWPASPGAELSLDSLLGELQIMIAVCIFPFSPRSHRTAILAASAGLPSMLLTIIEQDSTDALRRAWRSTRTLAIDVSCRVIVECMQKLFAGGMAARAVFRDVRFGHFVCSSRRTPDTEPPKDAAGNFMSYQSRLAAALLLHGATPNADAVAVLPGAARKWSTGLHRILFSAEFDKRVFVFMLAMKLRGNLLPLELRYEIISFLSRSPYDDYDEDGDL